MESWQPCPIAKSDFLEVEMSDLCLPHPQPLAAGACRTSEPHQPPFSSMPAAPLWRARLDAASDSSGLLAAIERNYSRHLRPRRLYV